MILYIIYELIDLPIPPATAVQQKPVIALVYGLTEEEIAVVEWR